MPTLHDKQTALSTSRRSVSSTELRSWKLAEELLCGEFGFILGLAPNEVKDYLQKQLDA